MSTALDCLQCTKNHTDNLVRFLKGVRLNWCSLFVQAFYRSTLKANVLFMRATLVIPSFWWRLRNVKLQEHNSMNHRKWQHEALDTNGLCTKMCTFTVWHSLTAINNIGAVKVGIEHSWQYSLFIRTKNKRFNIHRQKYKDIRNESMRNLPFVCTLVKVHGIFTKSKDALLNFWNTSRHLWLAFLLIMEIHKFSAAQHIQSAIFSDLCNDSNRINIEADKGVCVHSSMRTSKKA